MCKLYLDLTMIRNKIIENDLILDFTLLKKKHFCDNTFVDILVILCFTGQLL